MQIPFRHSPLLKPETKNPNSVTNQQCYSTIYSAAQQCTYQCYSTSFLDIRQSLSETTQKQPSHTWHINHSINVIINIINGLILSPFRLCLPN